MIVNIVRDKKLDISEKKIFSYLRRAKVVAENSPDHETKVGSILISKKTFSVISEGYNGFIRGANDVLLPKTRPDKYEYMIHAEENLICNAVRNGVSMDDCFVVQTISPCIRCARLLYQSGIDTIFYEKYYYGTDKVKDLGDLTFDYKIFEKFTKIQITPSKGYK